MLNDLRAAWRSLAKSPGFVAVAVLALGLGLGLSTSMFGVIDAVLNPQSAYKHGDRLYVVWPHLSLRGGSITVADIDRIVREKTHSFDAFVRWQRRPDADVGAEAREFSTMAVPPRWFDVYGVHPVLGRAFTDADGDGVAVVGYEAWQVLSGGSRRLGDAHVLVGERVYTVIGVLPRGAHAGVLVPVAAAEELADGIGQQVLRLASGMTPERAQAEMDALARWCTAQYGKSSAPWSLRLHRQRERPQQIQDIHKAMVGAAVAVLLIACVNLAHLMLARGQGKRRELAIRMALGAGRPAAVRLMLAESLLITVGGVALGAAVATWSSRLGRSLIPPEIGWAGFVQFQLSWRVFALGGVAAAVSALLFGLVPAIRVASSVELVEPLKTEAGTTTGGRHWRYSPLVMAEVALALALLMGGGLLLRSVDQLRSASLGYQPESLVLAPMRAVQSFRRAAGRVEATTADWNQALALARAVPGVEDAAIVSQVQPLGGAVTAEMTGDSTRLLPMQSYPAVSPSYLRVHGLPVLEGRDFLDGDAAGNGAAILSSVAAARLYPRGNAVGRMLKLGSPSSNAPWIPIVGVARTPIVPWEEQGIAGGPPIFWAVRPPSKWSAVTVLARAPSRQPRILIDLRRAMRSVPQVYAVSAYWITWERDAEVASRAFLAKVFVGMGGVGLALAALGLYGVLAYAVTRRMREFAVRIALGAEPQALFRMVMHDGMVMLLAGTGVGAFLALASSFLFNEILIGVYPTDALSLVAAEAVLLAAGLAAALAPARRAVRANPLDILRAV